MGDDAAYGGYVDFASGALIKGWLLDPNDLDRRCEVELIIDGNAVARVACTDPRPDLLNAGFRTSEHGFTFQVDDPLGPYDTIDVRIVDTTLCLEWLVERPSAGQEQSLPVSVGREDDAAEVPHARFVGHVDYASSSHIKGWVFVNSDPNLHPIVELLIDGTVIKSAIADLPRPDLIKAGFPNSEHGFMFPLAEVKGALAGSIPTTYGLSRDLVVRIAGTAVNLDWLVSMEPAFAEIPSIASPSRPVSAIPPYRCEAMLTLGLNDADLTEAWPSNPALMAARTVDEVLQALILQRLPPAVAGSKAFRPRREPGGATDEAVPPG